MAQADLQKQEPDNKAGDLERQRTRQSTLDNETDPGLELVVTGADGITPLVLDWDSPEDSDNPHNWTTASKLFQTLTPAFYCFVLYVALSSLTSVTY